MYQVLLQSKFVLTALLVKLRGTEIPAQRIIALALIAVSLVNFSVARNSTAVNLGSVQNSFIGIGFVLAKVFVSCAAAVVSNDAMKRWSLSESLLVMKVPWIFVLVVGMRLTSCDFNTVNVPVCVSYLVKCWLTLGLLKIMDSVTKNVGEAMSVVVTFCVFRSSAWLQLTLVVLALVNHEAIASHRVQ